MPAEFGASQPEHPISVPQVSPGELLAFHTDHFSDESLANFNLDFFSPTAAAAASAEAHASLTHEGWGYEDEEEDDDGLGYYEDGVKRTLTDEQIEIFRHSELRELGREQERLAQADGAAASPDRPGDKSNETEMFASGSRGGCSSDPRASRTKKKRKSPPNKEPKPDLRKRTWDVVEAGLDSLDYD